METIVYVQQTEDAQDLELPRYKSEGAAGMDLLANVHEDVVIKPGQIAKIGTGLTVELPPRHEIQIRPRSGIAYNDGVTVLNTPGTIDVDFRGEIGVILINLGKEPFLVKRGDRIAQMVVKEYVVAKLVKKDRLTETKRGKKGFGSTGV